MKKLVFALFIVGVCFTSFKKKQNSKTIMAVFAHSDDEAAINQLFAKYSKTNKVYLIIATDGRNGTKPGFPTGDTLVKLRQTESECACKITGIQPPVFLGFKDGFDTRNGVGPYMEQSKQLKEKLTQKITALHPDMIITFGPDGGTGHSDHRMISDMVTEIILKEGWVEKFPLYYLGWTKKQEAKFKVVGGLNTVDSQYLNISIRYSEEEKQKAMKALQCYKSQFSANEVEEWVAAEKKDSSNTLYFRQLTVPIKQKTDF